MNKDKFEAMALIKEIMTVILVMAVVFAWFMLMQLIISFVALAYITLKLKTMLIVSGVMAVVLGTLYEIKRIHKKKKYAEKLR